MNKKTALYLFTIIPLCFLTFICYTHIKHLKTSLHNTPIANALSLIPPKDRHLLDQLFHHLIISESFAYTLYGDKPISLSYCLRTQTHEPPFTIEQWNTWEKHKHLFPSKHYILRKINARKPDEAWILLINIKHFTKTFNRHRKLFQSILGPQTTAHDLIHTFRTHPLPFKKGLKNRAILKGILCGYGKNNSTLYLRKRTIEKALLAENTLIKPNHPYKTLQEELQALTSTLCLFNSLDHTLISFPYFLVDPTTQETKDLVKKYNKQRAHFLPLLTEHHFLERTLTHLTTP